VCGRPTRLGEAHGPDDSRPRKRPGHGADALGVDSVGQVNQVPNIVGRSRSGFQEHGQQGATSPTQHRFASSFQRSKSAELATVAFGLAGFVIICGGSHRLIPLAETVRTGGQPP